MQAQIIGSPVVLTPGTSATPGAQAITVPADAEGVLVFWSGYLGTTGADLTSLTSDFSGAFTLDSIAANSGTGTSFTGVGYARVSSVGSKTLTPVWSATVVEGPLLVAVFVKNIPKSGAWIRDTVADADAGATASVGVVSSAVSDLVLAFEQKFDAVPALESGWTSLATVGVTNSEGGRVRSADSPGAATTTATTQGSYYSSVAVASVMSNLVRVGQQTEAANSAAATTLVINITPAEAGSSLHLPITCSTGFTINTVVSSPALTWTQRNAVNDSNQALFDWTADNVTAVAHTITITFSGSASYRGAFAKEILATSGYDAAASAAHAAAITASPGTGADGITTGNTSALSAQPALISAATTPTPTVALAAAGTGFTLDGVGWAFSGDIGTSESKRVTATTALAATFTAPINTPFLAVASVFLEGAPPPAPTTTIVTGSATAGVGIAETYTYTLDASPAGTVTVTPTAPVAGSWSPTTVGLTSGNWNTGLTSNFTASAAGSGNIASTNDGGLTNDTLAVTVYSTSRPSAV